MNIQVGDRITYKNKFSFNTKIAILINDGPMDEETEILKIERIGTNGWYTVYEKEEKKELLTEEEKEFLKQFIKFNRYYIIYIIRTGYTIIFYTDCYYHREEKIEAKYKFFNKLENNRKYTLSELGLE